MSKPECKVPFERICYPVDPLSASPRAFAHALKLAALARGVLTVLHTRHANGAQTTDFSSVRQMLERWKLLPSGSAEGAIASLGLDIQNVISLDSETVGSVVRYLRRHPHDLTVLATSHRDGFQHWIHPEAPTLGHTSGVTLLLPPETEGFITAATGEANLSSILIPVDNFPDPQRAIDSAGALVEMLSCSGAEGTLLYVGDRERAPEIRGLKSAALKWRWAFRTGDIDAEILKAADEYHADLVVMATEGRHGFLDAFRGSTTERIVRQTRRPLLAVPAYRGEPGAHDTVAAELATGKLTV